MNPYLSYYMAKAHAEELLRQAQDQRDATQAGKRHTQLAAAITRARHGSHRSARREAIDRRSHLSGPS